MSETQTSQTVEPVTREVVVDCEPGRAFDLFTAEMTSWWPAEHHIGSTPIAEIVIEPHPGGRWYTRHEDGSETETGFVVLYDRPSDTARTGRFSVTWQVGADWKYHPDMVTTIDVRFAEESPGRTRVVLEHRDLDGFGEHAAQMKQVFEAPDAWTSTLADYVAAVG
jgi:activator of Hsp90 ATPase-like protein